MLLRGEKEQIVRDLKDKIEKSQAIFLTNLVGLTSNASTDLRKKVRDAKGAVVITRNTLLRKASEGTSAEQLLKDVKGPQALAFAFSDAVEVVKCLKNASEEFENVVTLKAGVLNGKMLSVTQLKQLAELPSRDQMLGTLLATFNAPISAFARVLNAIKEKKETEVTA